MFPIFEKFRRFIRTNTYEKLSKMSRSLNFSIDLAAPPQEIIANFTNMTLEDDDQCYGATEEDLARYQIIAYWMELLVQNVVAGLGIFANLVAITILCK